MNAYGTLGGGGPSSGQLKVHLPVRAEILLDLNLPTPVFPLLSRLCDAMVIAL